MQPSSLLLQGFLFFCKLLHTIEQTGNYLYNNSVVICYLTNYVCYISNYTYCTVMSQRIEPFGNEWTVKCWMTVDNDSLTQSHKYNEVYNKDICLVTWLFNVVDHFMTIFYGQHEVVVLASPNKNDEFYMDCISMIQPIFIQKTQSSFDENDSCYIVRFTPFPVTDLTKRGADVSAGVTVDDNVTVTADVTANVTADASLKKSKASFLTIEYIHPEMDKPIDFTLNKQWLISGNVLFTPCFVLRMLEYQSSMYYYDDRYIIRIIDKDVNIHDFGMDRYIELTDTGYILQGLELDIYNKCIGENTDTNANTNDGDVDTSNGNSDDFFDEKEQYISIDGTLVE